MLSTKDLVFKKQPAKKLVDWYVGPYIIDGVVSTNAVKLWLPILMRLHLVVNISRVVCYKEQVKEQKIKEVKLVEIEGVFFFLKSTIYYTEHSGSPCLQEIIYSWSTLTLLM